MVHPYAKGLIFDLDGTLADTMSMHLFSWRSLGKDFGVTITDQMILDRSGTPTFQVALDLNQTFGWSLDPEKVQQAKNHYYDQIKKKEGKIKPIERVCRIVESYKGKMPMAVGTGSTEENAEQAINDIGLKNCFVTIITAADVLRAKPHPEVFLKCANAIQILPAQCQVFEDGLMGFEAARAAGMLLTNVETGITVMPPSYTNR